MKNIVALVLSTLLVLATTAHSEEESRIVKVSEGYIKGESYLALDSTNKVAYIKGFIDGMFVAPVFGAREGQLDWVAKCTSTMSIVQLSAIVTKYFKDHPEIWHQPGNMHIYSALRDACKEAK